MHRTFHTHHTSRTSCTLRTLAATTFAAGLLGGCMVIPMAIGSWQNGRTHVIELTGPEFPERLFRDAAVQSGGVVTDVRSGEYAKAEFRDDSAIVELQSVGDSAIRVIGSQASRGFPSFPRMRGGARERTDAIVGHLTAHGFTVRGRPSDPVRERPANAIQERPPGDQRPGSHAVTSALHVFTGPARVRPAVDHL